MLAMSYLAAVIVAKEHSRKEIAGYPFKQWDNWTSKKVLMSNVCSCVMGLLTSMIGTSETYILFPIFMYYGLNPQVTVATAMYMLFWSKLTSSLLFTVSRDMDIGQWFWIGSIIFVTSLLTSVKVKDIIKKMKRPSIILFVFCMISGIAFVVVGLVF